MSDAPPPPPSLRYFINGTLIECTGNESLYVSAKSNITVECQYHDMNNLDNFFFKLSIDLETQLNVSQNAVSRHTIGDEAFHLPGYGTKSYFEFYRHDTPTPEYVKWRLVNNHLQQKFRLDHNRLNKFNYTISGVDWIYNLKISFIKINLLKSL